MITCEFKGELGNNLFQIAALVNVAESIGCDFALPTVRDCYTTRPIELDEMFEYQFKTIDSSYPNDNFEIYICPDIGSEPRKFEYTPIPQKDNMKIVGYFQSYKYFQEHNDVLLNKYFKFKEEHEKYIREKYPMIFDEECTSIHIRRGGDRPMLQSAHRHVDDEFYQEATSKLMEDDLLYKGVNTDRYVIFSDTLDYAKEMFGFEKNILYIEGEKNYIDMLLMSKCKNNIIGNSSFSWWSAWMNQHENKKIVAPKSQWFGPALKHLNIDDLFPEDWITL